MRLVDRGLFLLGVSFLLFVIFPAYYTALHDAPVNSDAGCFLPIVERIISGDVPYKDFSTAYAPLAFYLLAALKIFFPVPVIDPYMLYLGGTFLFHFGIAIIMFFLLCHVTQCLGLAVFSAALCLLLLFSHEGMFVFLEPFVAFFAVGSLYVFVVWSEQRWALFLSGFLAALAFLSKQYGIVAIAALGGGVLVNHCRFKKKIEQALFIILGMTTAITMVSIFFLLQGVTWQQMIDSIFYRGYPARPPQLGNVIWYFVSTHWYVLGALLLLGFKQMRRNSMFVTTVLMTLLFMAPLYVRQFLHYYGLFLPFLVITGAVSYRWLSQASSWSQPIALVLLAGMVLTGLRTADEVAKPISDPRSTQWQRAVAINSIWKKGERVLTFAHPAYIFLAGFQPVNDVEPAFGFLSNFPPENLKVMISNASKILIDTSDQSYFKPERERLQHAFHQDILMSLDHQGFYRVKVVDGVLELWEKRPS